MSEKWQVSAAAKRASVESLIPKEWLIKDAPSREAQKDVTGDYIHQFLSENEITITETDAVGITAKTTKGEWKALEVIKAFTHRAALAHQLVSQGITFQDTRLMYASQTNCLLEIFFEDGYKQAQELDEYYSKHGKPIGPLHGLPVSLKDQFHVKGVETTMGYVGWIGTFQGKKDTGKERVYESEMVKELRAMGAVLYCKTSVPHTLMSGQSVNHIMGYVWNPKNRLVSAGGSSGGEGALIGLRGSPVGFGTDIGGSIRIPAAYCGLYGIRPSAGRLPYEGMANSMEGQNTVLSVVGPLATTADSVRLLCKSILSQKPWLHDPLVVEMPWRSEEEREIEDTIKSGKKLCFGVNLFDGEVMPHPPVRRAVQLVVDAVKAAGHEVIEWDPTPTHPYLVELAQEAWASDGGADALGMFALSGEKAAPSVMFEGPLKPEDPASKIYALNVRKREAQKEYMEFWNNSIEKTNTGRPVDAIITPVAPFAAGAPSITPYYVYTTWVNCLDYSSVVVPVTLADKGIDIADKDFKATGELDEKIQSGYDAEMFHGAHVSVQLVGRRFTEEKTLAISEYVGSLLHK